MVPVARITLFFRASRSLRGVMLVFSARGKRNEHITYAMVGEQLCLEFRAK